MTMVSHPVINLTAAQCTIESVLVFLRGATVTRNLPFVPTDTGLYTLKIQYLSDACLPQSIRVVGQGGCEILEVQTVQLARNRDDVHEVPSRDMQDVSNLVSKLNSLWNDKGTLEIKRTATADKVALLRLCLQENLSNTNRSNNNGNTPSNTLDLEAALERITAYSMHAEALAKEELDTSVAIDAVLQNIWVVLHQLAVDLNICLSNESKADITSFRRIILDRLAQMQQVNVIEVSFAVNVISLDNPIQLQVVYRVQDYVASWLPTYDVRALPDGDVSLTFFGKVRQRTNKDWKSVRLSLSTVSLDEFIGNIPELPLEEVGYMTPPRIVPTTASRRMQLIADTQYSAGGMEIPLTTATVEGSGTSVSYTIKHLASIPSNEKVFCKITITVITLPCVWIRYCVPNLNPMVSMLAHLTNTSEYHLLESAYVSVYNHTGEYMGNRVLQKRVQPAESFTLSFGRDASVTVTHLPTNILGQGPGILGSTQSRTYKTETYLKSQDSSSEMSEFPKASPFVVMLTSYPVPTDSKIGVSLVHPTQVTSIDALNDMSLIADVLKESTSETTTTERCYLNKKNNHLIHFIPYPMKTIAESRLVYTVAWPVDKEIEIRQRPTEITK